MMTTRYAGTTLTDKYGRVYLSSHQAVKDYASQVRDRVAAREGVERAHLCIVDETPDHPRGWAVDAFVRSDEGRLSLHRQFYPETEVYAFLMA